MDADHFGIMRGGPLIRVIQAAKSACGLFAMNQARFFNPDRPTAWRGWENWLAVEVWRVLEGDTAWPFHRFPGKGDRRHMDIFVHDGRVKVAVEIKVNYIDDHEIEKWAPVRGLPDRVLKDRDKLRGLPEATRKLLIISTCFESRNGVAKYQRMVSQTLSKDFPGWQSQWHNCSSARDGGWNLLLALHR